MHLSVVILAAGEGKRMNSDLPKVLQPLAGQPLLQHVIRTAQGLRPANIYVVYGHGGAQVQAALSHQAVEWILQAQQLGTGHAVMQAMSVIPDEHIVLVPLVFRHLEKPHVVPDAHRTETDVHVGESHHHEAHPREPHVTPVQAAHTVVTFLSQGAFPDPVEHAAHKVAK